MGGGDAEIDLAGPVQQDKGDVYEIVNGVKAVTKDVRGGED